MSENLTAEEYWKRYEPGAFSLLMDPHQAMLDATTEALEVADKLGVKPTYSPVESLPSFSRCVWEIVYRDQ